MASSSSLQQVEGAVVVDVNLICLGVDVSAGRVVYAGHLGLKSGCVQRLCYQEWGTVSQREEMPALSTYCETSLTVMTYTLTSPYVAVPRGI